MVSPIHLKKDIDIAKLSFRDVTMSWKLLRIYLCHIIIRTWKRLLLYVLGLGLLLIVIDISGVLRHPFELPYEEFSHALNIPDFPGLIQKYRNNENVGIQPINTLYQNINYIETADDGCGGEQFRLIILVKSAGGNFRKRAAIRATWGNPRRFSDVPIKTVFILGRVGNPREMTNALDGKLRPISYTITAENGKYKDMVIADFRDAYYNNTLKTLLGLRWLVEICPNYRYAYFVDDDMYVSLKNLLKFIRNPAEYPQYWEDLRLAEDKKRHQQELEERKQKKKQNSIILNAISNSNQAESKIQTQYSKKETKYLAPSLSKPKNRKMKALRNNPADFEIDLAEDAKLYAGLVLFVPPLRHKFANKWFVSLDEYPYSYYPPYVPAGSIIMSKPVVQDFFYAAAFTKLFRFDDVYLGFIAKKLGIKPFHSKWFEMSRTSRSYYSKDYEYMIAVHDYEPDELKELWFVQKTLGNA